MGCFLVYRQKAYIVLLEERFKLNFISAVHKLGEIFQADGRNANKLEGRQHDVNLLFVWVFSFVSIPYC